MNDSVDIDRYISDLISDAVGVDGDVVAAQVSAALVERLRSEAPEMLARWLDMHAEAILRESCAGLIRSRRLRSRKKAVAGAFARAARAFEATGDADVLAPFEQRYVVDGADTRRRVRDMSRADCLFVAERYSISADRNAMEASFHRAVAQRVGDRTVGEVFTEAEYDRMYRSITNRPASAAG